MYGLHGKGKPGWSKGKTHLDDNRIAYGKRINSIGMLGKHHTEATKKKLSDFALNRTTPTVCKRTEPYKCVDGSIVNLDSSYERTVAKLLDAHKIKWNRPKPLIWIDKKNVQHHYFPDFYLVDYDVYLDPKNEYCFKVQKEKIDYVKAHYSNCFFLTKDQLTWIFIS